MARARVALNDGSILNVGQDSNLSIVKHDANTQQTDLELNFGRVRSQAVHLTKPGASFKIRTPTGVAGVVGTDFFLAFENFVTNLQVFEGSVQFCNLAGLCVTVTAGMMSQIRDPNQAPDAPVSIPTAAVIEAHTTTAMPAGTAATSVVATHSVLMSTMMVLDRCRSHGGRRDCCQNQYLRLHHGSRHLPEEIDSRLQVPAQRPACAEVCPRGALCAVTGELPLAPPRSPQPAAQRVKSVTRGEAQLPYSY